MKPRLLSAQPRKSDPFFQARPRPLTRPRGNLEKHSPANRTSDLSTLARHYYRNPQVQQRILEFLGGPHPRRITSRFLIGEALDDPPQPPREPIELADCLARGSEISRSLADRAFLLAHLDIEYVNFDFPAEVFLRRERAFSLQAPVIEIVSELFNEFGIEPLHLLSGRGHHFVWQMAFTSEAAQNLMQIGARQSDAAGHDSNPAFADSSAPARLNTAFTGLALVMEFLAHLIKERAAPRCRLPVEITAVEVGPGECGREMISIDTSEYGDPLSSRFIRIPFSIYLKPWRQAEWIGPDLVKSLEPIFLIPLVGMGEETGMRLQRDARKVTELAQQVRCRIPIQNEGMQTLIDRYLVSSLQPYHDWFYSHHPDEPDRWFRTYDLTPLEVLPSCARLILENPNDLLLRPWGMRLITRVFLSLGWHPRHIAGLIRSKFERDFSWGERWQGYSPAMRAEFYTRLFAGLFMVRRDDLVDFNCQSTQEEGACSNPHCPGNLAFLRQSAMARRRYGYLAHRPFNGLFLPKEHL